MSWIRLRTFVLAMFLAATGLAAQTTVVAGAADTDYRQYLVEACGDL